MGAFDDLLALINQSEAYNTQGLSAPRTLGGTGFPSLTRDMDFGYATPAAYGSTGNQGTGLTMNGAAELGQFMGLPTQGAIKQQADIQGTYNPITNYQWISTTNGIVPTGVYSGTQVMPDKAPTAYGASGAANISDGYWAPVYASDAKATLANQEAFAQQFGRLGSFGDMAAGSVGSGNNGLYTMDEQKLLASIIQGAGAGFANPFTNLAKNQTLLNSSFLGNILKDYIQRATGQTMGQLQGTPNLTNVQLAGDIANSMTGQPVSQTTSDFLNTIFGQGATGSPGGGVSNTPASTGGSASNTSGGNPSVVINNTGNPLMGPNPGFQTSYQDFSRLSPTVQAAYTDAAQYGPNGQTSTDFLNQLQQGAPQFAKSGNAQLTNAAGF